MRPLAARHAIGHACLRQRAGWRCRTGRCGRPIAVGLGYLVVLACLVFSVGLRGVTERASRAGRSGHSRAVSARLGPGAPVDGNVGGGGRSPRARADRTTTTGRYGCMSSRIGCSAAGPGDTAGVGQAGHRIGGVVKHEGGYAIVDRLGGERQRADIGDGTRWPDGRVPGQHAGRQVHSQYPGTPSDERRTGRPIPAPRAARCGRPVDASSWRPARRRSGRTLVRC